MDSQVNADIARIANAPQPAPYESRFIEAGGLRLHYLDYGTAGRPAMVCIHGGAANAHWFDFVAGAFSADYHVIALDLRGHGDSEWMVPAAYRFEDYAREVDEVTRKLGFKDFVLIGHSMGGKVALSYAADYPQRAGKLVVIDSNLQVSQERPSEMQDIGTRQGRDYATREEFVARFRIRPRGTVAAPEILQHLARHSCKQTPEGTWRHKFDRKVYAEHRPVDCAACWGRVRIPAMLMKAALSERVTPQIKAEVKARCPHAEHIEIPNSYHHVTLDNPPAFNAAIKAFLARNSQ
jgi:pimeloyl-ACP methyl ester carboxylesterase